MFNSESQAAPAKSFYVLLGEPGSPRQISDSESQARAGDEDGGGKGDSLDRGARGMA